MIVVAVIVSIAGCGGGSTSVDPYRLAASALCDAAARAKEGDLLGAEEVFYDSSHQRLHDLAAEVSNTDRAVAARLLEAKETVESGLGGDGSELGDAFDSLVVATDEALAATEHDPMPCTPADESDG